MISSQSVDFFSEISFEKGAEKFYLNLFEHSLNCSVSNFTLAMDKNRFELVCPKSASISSY